MEEYKMIIAGLIGSIITIIIKAIIDTHTDSVQYKQELKKLVFQRKTDAVERAMSWFQEAINCYSIMQMGYNELGAKYNPVVLSKIESSLIKSLELYDESPIRLNQIYLYYDFSDIEYLFGTRESMEFINSTIASIGALDQDARALRLAGKDDESPEIQQLQARAIELFKGLPEAINTQMAHIAEIQNIIRREYKSYLE